jgi:hypothetical protein
MAPHCKLSKFELAQRLTLATYQGLPAYPAVGSDYNFAYVVSGTVPDNFYWVVAACSLFFDVTTAWGHDQNNQQGSLYLLRPGAVIPPNGANSNASYAQQKIFLSHVGGSPNPTDVCNGPPVDPAFGIRIDDSIGSDVSAPSGEPTPFEQSMFRGRTPLIMPQGFTLLGYNGLDIGAGVVGVYITMKILYAQLKTTEDFDWF